MALFVGVPTNSSPEVPLGLLWSSGRFWRPQVICSVALKKRSNVSCFSMRENGVHKLGSVDHIGVTSCEEKDMSHVIKFKMSDFKIHDCVSIGLGHRADELIYEATIQEASSPLFNTRVVLRRLLSKQARRRGRRSIEVLKRLSGRRLLYHSYSMQVHGYVCLPTVGDSDSFMLVHGYHGSSSLRHWLQQADWLPMLEAALALDEGSGKRIGDHKVGGPEVSRQLRLVRILMRDLLIGVNYLHSHGLAHTELRLENLHISPVDKHIKVGILGNASDFNDSSLANNKVESNSDRRRMMIAFDMRCVGFVMAKMILRDLMNPDVFAKLKIFLSKGNDPSCLRDFLMRIVTQSSSIENRGFKMLDRNWGAGWHLLSLLLANKPSRKISCIDALRHPFLCGPRWRVNPTIEMIRWSLGSTAIRITEEYIYAHQQRRRIAHFIELMEMLNPHSRPRDWLSLLPGNWRLLYSTGRHVGLTLRQSPNRVLISHVQLKIAKLSASHATFSIESTIQFKVMVGKNWSPDKSGTSGKLQVNYLSKLRAGRRLYVDEETTKGVYSAIIEKLSSKKWTRMVPIKQVPSSLPITKFVSNNLEISMSLDEPLSADIASAQNVLREVRIQIPPESFDPLKIVCGTYIDSRLLVLRSVNGSALLLIRDY